MAKEKTSSKLTKLINVENIPDEQKTKKSLTQIANALNKKNIGSNKVALASTKSAPEVIPTGIVSIDYIMGVGGLPRGRMGQIYGAESSYKSTACLHVIANGQKNGATAAYIDAERTFDPSWARKNGVDLNNLLILEPDTSEEGLNQITYLINEGIDIIVVDSVVALAPKKEVFDDDKGGVADIEKEAMGIFGRKMSQWCRSNIGRIAKQKTLLIWINQLRDNLSAGLYGNPTSVPGGRALKFYSSFMIAAKKVTGKDGAIKTGDEIVGQKYTFKADKNKVARFGKEFTFAVYDSILDNYTTLMELALKDDIIKNGLKEDGTINKLSYVFENEIISKNGKPGILKKLYQDKDFYNKLYSKVIKTANIASFDPYEKFKEGTEIEVDIPEVAEGEEPEE